MINIIIQNLGAHSETLPTFVELLHGNCQVFYPAGRAGPVSYVSLIVAKYGVVVLEKIETLETAIANDPSHGLLLFNSSFEIKEEFAKRLLLMWRGRVASYNHDMQEVESNDVIDVYPHPFKYIDKFILPINEIFGRRPETMSSDATILIPNWTRVSHLANKDVSFLNETIERLRPKGVKFIITGMSSDIIAEALKSLKSPFYPKVLTKLSINELSKLCQSGHTYIMPLIKKGGRYDNGGLTGAIPMAFNSSVPLIISSHTAKQYDIQAFVDEERIFDIDLSDSKFYAKCTAEIGEEGVRIRNRNAVRFDMIFKRVSTPTSLNAGLDEGSTTSGC